MSHSNAGLNLVSVETVSVSNYMPYLREKFLAPEAGLALLHYEGQLGGRTVAEPVLLTTKGKFVSFELSADARQEFQELCLALLEERYPYWPESEGAEGRFVWNLTDNLLTHWHSVRNLQEYDEDGIALATHVHGWRESDIPF